MARIQLLYDPAQRPNLALPCGAPLVRKSGRCYNAHNRMADWKQITARIRKARTSKDPTGQLTGLFEKTQDAMVAFELGRYLETSGHASDAAKWYITAAERFRRADWKSKAQEAAVRLGAAASLTNAEAEEGASRRIVAIAPDPAAPFEQNAEIFEEAVTENVEAESSESEQPASATSETSGSPVRKSRRRGRRGGRNRRRSANTSASASSTTAQRRESSEPDASEAEIAPPRVVDSRSIPSVPVESAREGTLTGPKGRFGDPGLSSRLSLLEMQFRRLLTCPPAKLDQNASAPAGPGVFVLTDDEMTSYYYVEACDTLRIAIGNLSRGSRGRGISIKPQLAEHLGIAEARVGKYLSDHCVVRWLQLDEGAQYFAHFAVSVLRPILNE